MKNTSQPEPAASCYVGSRKEEGFCWLLSDDGNHQAEDQNIGWARRFTSLEEAAAAAHEELAAVFEVIDETVWPAKLKEVR